MQTELEAARAAGERLTATLGHAVAFSSDLADSAGESLARVAIHRTGFAPPTLQQEFRDAQGLMVVDFWWPTTQTVIEFDGKVKYTRSEYTSGDPSQVVWREKLREDRLRRLVRKVDRVVMSDILDPNRLRRILSDAGVPGRGH
jgi:hypothetical protein